MYLHTNNNAAVEKKSTTTFDTDKVSDMFLQIRKGVLFETYGGKGADSSRSADPKGEREHKFLLFTVRFYLNKIVEDRASGFWDVFEAAYADDLEMDAWNGTIYYKGAYVTETELVANLENVVKFSRPRADAGFYQRQLERITKAKQFAPVKRYLDDCAKRYSRVERLEPDWEDVELLPEWDRLGEVLFGLKDELTQQMITTWLVAAVKRGLNPGCHMKRALILKGNQDAGKSSFVRILGKAWATEMPSGVSDADFIRLCLRTWIMELAEADRLFKGKEAAILKQQISTTHDTYVPKYSNETKTTPRTTVFIGTTNKAQFLVDETGNNRFWLVDLPDGWKLPLEWLRENVDQLWATAYAKLLSGYPTDLDDASLTASELRNHGYLVEGTWNEQLEVTLDKVTCNGTRSVAFKLVDIMSSMYVRFENQSKHKTQVITSLKQLGYEMKPIRVNGKVQKLYALPSDSAKVTPAIYDIEKSEWLYLS